MTIGAYILIEPSTGYFYIGSSENVEARIERHYRALLQGTHHCIPLQQVWNQSQHLEPQIYATNTREEAYELEQALIYAHSYNRDDMLNVGLGVKGGDNLTRNPKREQIIRSMTTTLNQTLAQMPPDVRKEKWGRPGSSNPMHGRTHCDEVRQKLSEVHRGNQYALGSKRTDEQRQRLSKIASERIGDRNSFFGKTHSEETKEKIRAAKIGSGSPSNALKVSVNGVVYDSVKKACDGEGISYPTMVKRINSPDPKYSTYYFVS